VQETLSIYATILPGEAVLFGNFAENEVGCFDWGEACAEEGNAVEAKLWLNSVPFWESGCGDCLALYVGEDRPGSEFPVVFLDHDGHSIGPVAPSFDAFLKTWEELSYLHGFFLFQYFWDEHRGIIDATSPNKAGLDELFRLGKGSGG
jgi:hypothetical protein